MSPGVARAVGIALIAGGLVTLALLGSYAGYRAYGRSNLDDLNFSVVEVGRAAQVQAAHERADDPSPATGEVNGPEAAEASPGGERTGAADLASATGVGGARPAPASASGLARAYALMFEGVEIHPKYWHEPLRAGTELRGAPGLPDGFVPASAHDYRRFARPKSVAMRMSIPSIGVDSDVRELAIVNLGDSRSYETPKNTVGHIPESADPGELGNGWFFGHLESPFRGEGNVFRRLPEVPDLLRHYAEVGEGSVYVVLESEAGQFLYEAVATEVVLAEDLRLYDTEGVYITLVTCVPRLDYTHRLLVTARLVGVGL